MIESPDGCGGTNRIGVIDLPSFYATVSLSGNSGHTERSTTADVTRLIKKLEQENVTGLILDLRGNPGGSLEEAIKFTGLFIKDGPVVLTRNSNGRVSVDSDTDSSVLYDGPLVVLFNCFSASASEIVAAALQDYGRALTVGDTSTFGKGTVQNLDPLRPFIWPATASATNDPGTLKITVGKYYRVTGASAQLRGVMPDIILPDTLSCRTDITSERTMENALPWDTIQPVNYNKLNLVQPYLNLLRERSDARVATNQEFVYIRQDIAELQKLQTDKTATLNEREALKEREKIAAQNKARDTERDARKAPDEKIYELTVENCDQPGRPSLPGQTNEVVASGTTNTVTAATGGKTPPPIDPMLDETENILEDYVSLLSKSNILIANHINL